MTKKFICIVCPRGCHLEVDENLNVKGNSCPRGEVYGKEEATMPKRVITTTVKIDSEFAGALPVKTNGTVPKEKIFEIIKLIKDVKVKAPVKIGDVIIPNLLGLGVDLVSTKNIEK